VVPTTLVLVLVAVVKLGRRICAVLPPSAASKPVLALVSLSGPLESALPMKTIYVLLQLLAAESGDLKVPYWLV